MAKLTSLVAVVVMMSMLAVGIMTTTAVPTRTGPSRGTSPSAPTIRSTTSHLRPARRVESPLTRYGPDPVQQALLDRAVQVLVSRCMASRGEPYSADTPTASALRWQARLDDSRRYGITDADEAAVQGYLPPGNPFLPTPARADLSPQQERLLVGPRGCYAVARSQLYGHERAAERAYLAARLSTQAWLRSRTRPAVRTVIQEWSRCMRAASYVVTDPVEIHIGASDRSRPAPGEVELALADIGCKGQTDLVRRWSEQEAQEANRLISRHAARLARGEAILTVALDRARSLTSTGATYRELHGGP